MVASGVVAGVGVLTGSSILVVAAMALSPDLLPISAAAVGLLERRWRLMTRAVATLVAGMTVAIIAAAVTTFVLRLTHRIDENLDLADSVLGPSLTKVGPGSVLVALAAGMAGMLAYETAGSAAVGVAISVTTIPAAAYVGVAAGLGGARTESVRSACWPRTSWQSRRRAQRRCGSSGAVRHDVMVRDGRCDPTTCRVPPSVTSGRGGRRATDRARRAGRFHGPRRLGSTA
jgi:uncharacterized hydrophobic protein (TIGR00271 family)